MNPVFVIQYYPYQYKQFKKLIEALGCDVYYKCSTINFTEDNRDSSKDEFYSLDGTKYESRKFPKVYDYMIYTGPCNATIMKFAKRITSSGLVICLAHSLMGTLYDCKMGMPYEPNSIGVIPKIWEDFDSYRHALRLYDQWGKTTKYLTSISNPIVAECLSYTPTVQVEKGTIGLVLGELSPFEQALAMGLRNLDRLRCNKLKVKFHPLTRTEDKALFENNPKIEILPIDTFKYDFTDSCEYLVGGASTLILEAILRAKYFKINDQKFARLKIRRGIDINLPILDNYNPEKDTINNFTMYDSLIMEPEEVIKEHVNIISDIARKEVKWI